MTCGSGAAAGGDLESACADAGLPFLELPLRGPWDPVSASKLRKHLRRHETDILHVHKGRAHGVGLVAAIGMGHRPRLVVNRGVTFPLDIFNKWKYRHPRVASVVCVADAVRDVVMQFRRPQPRLVSTPSTAGPTQTFFDPGRADVATCGSELGIDPDHLVVGQVSVRGLEGMVRSRGSIRPRRCDDLPLRDSSSWGANRRPKRQRVERAAAKAGLAGRVQTLPFRTDMPEVLAACDIVVDASWARHRDHRHDPRGDGDGPVGDGHRLRREPGAGGRWRGRSGGTST